MKSFTYILIIAVIGWCFMFNSNAYGQYVQEWLIPYQKAGAIMPPTVVKMQAVGEHIYLLGTVQGENIAEEDFLLLKLDRSGNIVWVQTYAGPGDYHDVPTDMAFDNYGNIYVTGLSYQSPVGVDASDYWTMKYSPDGSVLWTATYTSEPGHGDEPCGIEVWNKMVFVSGKSVHVAGPSTAEDYHSEVYDANTGKRIWMHSWNGAGGDRRNNPNDMTLDAGGNMIVVGRSTHPNDDYSIVRYKWDTVYVSSDSIQIVLVFDWERYFNGSGDERDYAYAVVTNIAGDIYVTGEGWSSEGRQDITTVKYDKFGNLKWSRNMNGTNNNRDMPIGIALDSEEYVIVVGYLWNLKSDKDFCTVKYTPNGDSVWTTAWWNMAGQTNFPKDFVLDSEDNIYITGDKMSQMYVRKLNKDGNITWEGVVVDANGQQIMGEGHAITVDYDGNIYIAGLNIIKMNQLTITKFKK
ncbi:MAG: SBBP repeat-containing protein [Ignavibacteria bacterium]|nr:SBBP repeat-containing protein [Ignavibacteria bacterium]